MKALTVYDSVFGNTEKVAQAMGAALEGQAEVTTKRVGAVTAADLAGVDAVVAGSPTRKFTATPAIKNWIKGLPSGSLQGVKVAAFDTRVEIKEDTPGILKFFVNLFGYAAEPMAKSLVKKGGSQAMEPAGFIVAGSEGPMREGERERAAAHLGARRRERAGRTAMKRVLVRAGMIVTVLSSLWGSGGMVPTASRAATADVLSMSVEGNAVEVIEAGANYYRAQGLVEITIRGSALGTDTYRVVSASGSCVSGGCGTQAVLDFAVDSAGVALSHVDMDAIPPFPVGLTNVTYRLSGTYGVYDTESDELRYTGSLSYDLRLTKNRIIKINTPSYPWFSISVREGVYQNGLYLTRPLPGETVTPTSEVFEFVPESTTTDQYGSAHFYMLPRDDATRLSPTAVTDDYFSGNVTVDVSGDQQETLPVTLAYARVSCLRGAVLKVDGLGNTTRLQMDDKLNPGDVVKLMSAEYDAQGNPIYPMVCLDFFNGQRHIAESAFAKEGSYINIEIGPEGVSGTHDQPWLIDLQNLKMDVVDNHREYLKLGVYHLLASRMVAPLQMGWKATTVTKTTIKAFLARTFGSKGSLLALPPADATLGGVSYGVPRPSATLDLGFTVPYIALTFMGDGAVRVTNWDGLVEITSEEEETGAPRAGVVLPLGTTTSVDGEYTAFAPVAAVPVSPTPGKMTIMPTDDSHLTEPPLIEVTFPWYLSDPVLQSTLDVRLNGVSIAPMMFRQDNTSTSASWQSPRDWPFLSGDNVIEASMMSRSGATLAATSHFTLEMLPQPPEFLKAYRGPTSTILRWQPVRQADVVGYHVYRAEAPEAPPELVTPSPVPDPFFIAVEPGWYSVAAVTLGGMIGPSAGPVLGDPDPTAIADASAGSAGSALDGRDPTAITGAPPVPEGFRIHTEESAVTVSFEPGAFVPLYRLERAAASSGPYATLAHLTRGHYVDRDIAVGRTYWYRLTALGLEQTPSEPAGPLSATIIDGPPPRPTGLAVLPRHDGMHVLWDPSPAADSAGYNLYRAEMAGPFVKLNQELLTSPDMMDQVMINSTYAWRVTAVDTAGHEGPPSTDVEVSTWLKLMTAYTQGPDTYVYLPLIIR